MTVMWTGDTDLKRHSDFGFGPSYEKTAILFVNELGCTIVLLNKTTSIEPILPCYPIVVFKLLWNVKKYELFVCSFINFLVNNSLFWLM